MMLRSAGTEGVESNRRVGRVRWTLTFFQNQKIAVIPFNHLKAIYYVNSSNRYRFGFQPFLELRT
jgi:hypothetical protein